MRVTPDAVLKMQINKSDRNDAAGIAAFMQTGWFKEVRVKASITTRLGHCWRPGVLVKTSVI